MKHNFHSLSYERKIKRYSLHLRPNGTENLVTLFSLSLEEYQLQNSNSLHQSHGPKHEKSNLFDYVINLDHTVTIAEKPVPVLHQLQPRHLTLNHQQQYTKHFHLMTPRGRIRKKKKPLIVDHYLTLVNIMK